jgi:hypothetical protein
MNAKYSINIHKNKSSFLMDKYNIEKQLNPAVAIANIDEPFTAYDFEKLGDFPTQYLAGMLFTSLKNKGIKVFHYSDCSIDSNSIQKVLIDYLTALPKNIMINMESAYELSGGIKGMLEKTSLFKEENESIIMDESLIDILLKNNYIANAERGY